MILPSYLVLYEDDTYVFVAYGQADLLTFASWKILFYYLLLILFSWHFLIISPPISMSSAKIAL